MPASSPSTLLLILSAITLVTLTGCGGCSKDATTGAQAEQEKEKEKLKKKDEEKDKFEIKRPRAQPHDPEEAFTGVKPGHWVSASQEMKTNFFDFTGEIRASIVGHSQKPVHLQGTRFRLATTRTVALPKGQQKFPEMTFFVPRDTRRASLAVELVGSGVHVQHGQDAFIVMPHFQYHFVVLAREPKRYDHLARQHWAVAPWSGEDTENDTRYYRVVKPDTESQRLTLPSNPLTWTSIAYMLWDDVHPDKLTPEQRTAMIDWLHWGGQLIISGPNSLESLKGSFLDPWLPAAAGATRMMLASDFEILNANWSLPHSTKKLPRVEPVGDWSGIDLEPRAEAVPLPDTGDLFLERYVGRGRIVVSAFRLSDRYFRTWAGYDSFYNACLLRRPPRRYKEGYTGDPVLEWTKPELSRLDPRLITKVRYFTRDTGTSTAYVRRSEEARNQQWGYEEMPDEDILRMDPAVSGGAASWNTQSDLADAVRESLRKAAGIVIPKARFVLVVLVFYLAILVPLNWLVFYTIGRVEWAWIAAPCIAVVCSLSVIRLAQLDIGFARAQTEIGILEAHEGHPRAHLTRYSALYTSLSTAYDFHFDDMSALAQPFPLNPNKASRRLIDRQPQTVTYRRQQNVQLTDVAISSNTTDLIHSEQMLDMEGALKLGRSRISDKTTLHNGTKWSLTEVFLMRNHVLPLGDRVRQICWLGDLPAGKTAELGSSRFTTAPEEELPFATERKMSARVADRNRLDLSAIFPLTENWDDLRAGDMRLLARIDKPLPGLTIDPAASQVRSSTVVIAHLTFGPPETPFGDANAPIQIGSQEADTMDYGFEDDLEDEDAEADLRF